MLKTAELRVQVAKMLYYNDIGDGELMNNTIREWEAAPSLIDMQAEKRVTFNADAVGFHQDVSERGQEMAELESLFCVEMTHEDMRAVGLLETQPGGVPVAEEVRTLDPNRGVLYAADYGHGHALRPGLDVGFADFRHVKVRLCQCVKVWVRQ
eukprot:COSAG01_NODE_5242_length_4389_cov_100.681352_4_plen_153_part_00